MAKFKMGDKARVVHCGWNPAFTGMVVEIIGPREMLPGTNIVAYRITSSKLERFSATTNWYGEEHLLEPIIDNSNWGRDWFNKNIHITTEDPNEIPDINSSSNRVKQPL